MSWLGRMVGYQKPAPAMGPGESKLGELTVQQVHTFNALLNTFSKTYSFRYDEAMRQDPAFALAMRRDAFIRALLQERLLPLTRWKWSLVPEDPEHDQQATRAKWYEGVVKAQPNLSKKLLYLGHSAWYGRYGSQCAYVDDTVEGKPCKRIGKHRPVNGDKLVFDWETDDVGIRINSTVAGNYPKDCITYDDRGSPILMLRRPELRKKFVVHCHELDDADFFEPEMAGRVKGIGLRDFAYYGAYLRQQLIKWAVNFMEKVGTLGLLVFWYPEGNAGAKTQAEAAAKNASNRSALAVPMPKGADKKSAGVDLLPANMTGVQFLVDIIAGWWEKHVERLFVGQSMSAGADNESGLGGSGRADFAKDTKFNLLQFDAVGLAETLTEDEIKPLCELNGDPGWKLRWEFALPDPEAEAKLGAITKAASLPGKKLEYKAVEVRALTGMSEPGPDDDVVGGEDPMGPGIGPDGMPLPGSEILHGGGRLPGTGGGGAGAGAGAGKSAAGQVPESGTSATPPEPDTSEPDADSEGADRPHPEAEALALAMTRAAEEGDEAALDELAALADDPDAIEGILEEEEGDGDEGEAEPTVPNSSGVASYAWTAGQTKSGKVKAVGNAEHNGKTLYGAKAEAALRAQGKRANPEPTAKERKKAASAEKQKGKAAAVDAAKAAAHKATTDPKSLSAADLTELAGHLKTLTVAQMKGFARAVKANVSGTKQALADRLLGYVRGEAAKPKTPEKPATEPKPTTAKIGGLDFPPGEADILAKRRAGLGADAPPPAGPQAATPEEPVKTSDKPKEEPKKEPKKPAVESAKSAEGDLPETDAGKAVVAIYDRAATMTDADLEAAKAHVAKMPAAEVRRTAAAMGHYGKATKQTILDRITDRRGATIRRGLIDRRQPTSAGEADPADPLATGAGAEAQPVADSPEKPAGKQKVDASAKETSDLIDKTRDPAAVTPADIEKHLAKLRADHTDDELREIAKIATGRGGRTAKQALALIEQDLTAVHRALESQKV